MPLSAADIERAERALKRTIAKRNGIVAQVSLLHELAQRLELDTSVLRVFRARRKDVDSLRNQFMLEQDSIFDLLIQLQREDEYDQNHSPLDAILTEQYYSIIAIADDVCGNNPPSVITTTSDTKDQSNHLQLPKIQLPSFDGDILRWITFRDTFRSLVHDNDHIPKIAKFHHLLAAVTGSAGAVVRSIPLSEANYEVAWKALWERFNNPRLIISAHMDKIFNYPSVKSDSLFDLKAFLDTFKENIGALQSFDIPDKEGFFLFYVASRVLDSTTRCHFESQYNSDALPVINDLLNFVQTRCQVLQNSSTSIPPVSNVHKLKVGVKKNSSYPRTSLVASSTESVNSCPVCKGSHYIGRCATFLNLPTAQRLQKIQSLRMCTNCMSTVHTSSKCESKYSCRHCSARHHSLLHLGEIEKKASSSATSGTHSLPKTKPKPSTSSTEQSSTAFVGTVNTTSLNVLGTALIRVRDKFGQWTPVRALIDSGSQISAITHISATRLGLNRHPSDITVVGLSQSPILQTKGSVTCHIIPHTSFAPELICEPVILSKITGLMPSAALSPAIRSTYSKLQLADPSFDCPGRIDFLIGADMYNKLFENGYQVLHEDGLPSAFETSLGWIFVGTSSQCHAQSRVCLKLSSEPSLKELLHRFWACEEPECQSIPFTEQEKCEDIFQRTTSRDNTGRYVVSLPFKMDPSILGDSRSMALSRFFNLERKLQAEPEVYAEYRQFMSEYQSLGHMKVATTPGKYLIPHHAVIKYAKDKMKLRVVFDASARTSSGVSLNDTLFVGPKLQCDIMNILLRCRLNKYMFTADICKMYRQINIHSPHCDYQHILWRDDPSKPLVEYALTTVTYGVASSLYQALRVLHQLERDEGHQFKRVLGVLTTETYVDDIITGAETIPDTLTLQRNVIKLLGAGGLELKKWASNCPAVIQDIPAEDRVMESSFDPKDHCSVKILGLHWDPVLDIFSYHSESYTSTTTKRSVLSAIAKIYDPLGILSPITFWAKCFMQALWKNGYDWDQPISSEMASSWKTFTSELPCVSSVSIQRYIPTEQSSKVSLLGFSDASLNGYAAVVYMRLEYSSMPPTVHLITTRSKVAPLKSGKTDELLSVPRLELCGALLLAQTLHRVQTTLAVKINIQEVHAWTDSTVVLSWLTSQQIEFKTFVTNRLKKISELLPNCHWHYVSTHHNPADCASRGMYPKEMLSHSLYWNGPGLLKQSVNHWTIANFHVVPSDLLPERKLVVDTVHLVTVPCGDTSWLERFSSFTRLQRVLVHIRRFIACSRQLPTYTGYIRQSELDDALKILVKTTQSQNLYSVVIGLTSSKNTAIPVSIARLSPFLDPDGIIRVGGRLRHANANEDFKHPILLPKSCVLTTLLVRHFHLNHLHAGPQLVSSLLSARFWIISSRSVIRHIIFKCVPCATHRASIPSPVMGDLPKSRVQSVRPFSNVGIDYAGPLAIKEGKRRNARASKCYLAIFVCMAVKAVHVEVVSDLSTPAFIAALQRFVSRRGVPMNIYSDCGTNFQGADNVLRFHLQDPSARDLLSAAIPCKWHFNPPAAPHFGGLWEAAVKSVKYHLKRVIGNQLLTFEEMVTLTHRIEAVLNSRPITPMSTDPNDLRALTPGDFLIGCPILALPDPDVTSTPINRLTRWQLLNQLQQSFWNRWSAEYLSTLQGKSKWYRKQANLRVGDLVLLRRPNVPPTVWKMGRVVTTHPGDDGVVRVVTVRTQDGIYKRPVVQLAILPVEDDSDIHNSVI